MSRFETKKSLGQHFLRTPEIARNIAAAGEISPGEIVLEIGPGTGILTEALLELGAQVIAVEADLRAIDVLKERFSEAVSSKKLMLHHGDIRELSFESLGLRSGEFKIIANIPYYISGLLFRMALGGSIKPSVLVFLVQKEVALRIAKSEKESLLSLGVKVYGDPEYVMTVRKGSFVPPPKVDSAVIRVRNISNRRLGTLSDEAFFTIVRMGLQSRRKQLFGALRGSFSESDIRAAFTAVGIEEKVRGEDLSVEEWLHLARVLHT